jgi:SAM-dependent methyltransferase
MLQSPYRWVPVVSDVYRMGCRQLAKIWFAGSQVECPICEKHFSRWRGDLRLGNCPYCGSAPRHRLLKLSLAREWTGRARSLDVLHFAPEWGAEHAFRANPRVGRYVTADLSAPGVDVHCDITDLRFEDDAFDVVVCSHVLEHVRDDRKALAELHRVLRPGGVAYIQVPYDAERHTDEDPCVTDPGERERRFGQFDHVRMYGCDLIERIRQVGFVVDELRPTRSMREAEVVRFGLWDDNIFRCQVRGVA